MIRRNSLRPSIFFIRYSQCHAQPSIASFQTYYSLNDRSKLSLSVHSLGTFLRRQPSRVACERSLGDPHKRVWTTRLDADIRVVEQGSCLWVGIRAARAYIHLISDRNLYVKTFTEQTKWIQFPRRQNAPESLWRASFRRVFSNRRGTPTVQLCSHTCSQTFPAHQIHSALQFRKTSVTYRHHVLPLRA